MERHNANPGNFALGTLRSRAAARMRLEQKWDSLPRLEIVTNVARPWRGEGSEPPSWSGEPRFDPWQDYGDRLMRMVFLPGTWISDPPEHVPVCSGCGTPFVEVKRLGGMVYLQANCEELHDPDRVSTHGRE